MSSDDYKELAVLGDSIANGFYDETGIGWVGRFVQKLNAEKPFGYYYNNYATSGDRIFDVWHRLCADVIPRQPDILIVAVGTNDLIRWNSLDAPVDVTLEMRDEFWRLLLDTAKKNVEHIFVLGLMPVNEKKNPGTGAFDKKFYQKNEDIVAYNRFIAAQCERAGVSFFDFYDDFIAGGIEDLLYDTDHPSTAGHELMAKLCFENIKI